MMMKAYRHWNQHPPFFFSWRWQEIPPAAADTMSMVSFQEEHLHDPEKSRG
jgi:hypothetical protein